jgi:hypothetical protein
MFATHQNVVMELIRRKLYINSTYLEEHTVFCFIVTLDLLSLEGVIDDHAIAEELQVRCEFGGCLVTRDLRDDDRNQPQRCRVGFQAIEDVLGVCEVEVLGWKQGVEVIDVGDFGDCKEYLTRLSIERCNTLSRVCKATRMLRIKILRHLVC